jgi:uncharacterized protein YeaO (DUF488 family)
MTELKIKRIYAAAEPGDGARILVDRLWPRGVSKAEAGITLWLKDLSPSDALRKRFHGHPDNWDQFRAAYAEELKGETAQAAVTILRQHMAKGAVTLLYAAKDEARNNAAALKLWL